MGGKDGVEENAFSDSRKMLLVTEEKQSNVDVSDSISQLYLGEF